MSIYQGFSDREREILQARAESISHDTRKADPKDLLTALVVMAGQEVYALPIQAIANVYEGLSVIPIPCVPPFVSGVVNIRGHLILALDLAALVGTPDEAKSETTWSVMLANSELAAAFQVKSIRGIESFSVSDLVAVPDQIGLRHSAYIDGILPDSTIVLNVDTIVSDPSLIVDIEQV